MWYFNNYITFVLIVSTILLIDVTILRPGLVVSAAAASSSYTDDTKVDAGGKNGVPINDDKLPDADFVVTVPIDDIGDDTTSTSLFKIAFGSCHKTKYADANIWKTIQNKENPISFLWLGDSIYPPYRGIATVPQVEDEYHRMLYNTTVGYNQFLHYMQQQYQIMLMKTNTGSNSPHKKLTPTSTIFGTWDDHDYGGNDMGDGMMDKHDRAKLFWNFLGHTSTPTSTIDDEATKSISIPPTKRDGIYYSVLYQTTTTTTTSTTTPFNIKVLFLDTRWHRSDHCLPCVTGKIPLGAGISCAIRWFSAGILPNYCTNKVGTLLGTNQWEWLEQELQQAQSKPVVDLLIIASSIQVLTTNPTVESWGHYPKERKRLLSLLAKQQQYYQPTIILSGDVHYAEILDPTSALTTTDTTTSKYDNINKDNVPFKSFIEVTSSALSHDCTHGVYGFLCEPLQKIFSKHRGMNHTNHNYYIGRNYGVISIHKNRTTTVSIHKVEDGTTVLSTGPIPLAREQYQQQSSSTFQWTEQYIDSIYSCTDGHLLPLAYTLILLLVVGIASFSYLSRK